MKSLIDRQEIKKGLEDPNVDTSDYKRAKKKFDEAKANYRSEKQSYNRFIRYKMNRMNVNTMTMLSKLYKSLKKAREQYCEAKLNLNTLTITTFSEKVDLELSIKSAKNLSIMLSKIAEDDSFNDDDVISVSLFKNKEGRVL